MTAHCTGTGNKCSSEELRGSMNPVSVSAETHRQFRPKPNLAEARPTENEISPKLNFLPILATKPKPKFGRSLSVSRHWRAVWSGRRDWQSGLLVWRGHNGINLVLAIELTSCSYV